MAAVLTHKNGKDSKVSGKSGGKCHFGLGEGRLRKGVVPSGVSANGLRESGSELRTCRSQCLGSC